MSSSTTYHPPSSSSRNSSSTQNPPSLPTRTRHQSTQFLTEQYIQDAFHSYLKSSLTQAKAERLLDEDVLASAEGDLMITGPALCLYFAALRCTTNPPSVPLPRSRKSSSPGNSNEPHELSYDNCPPAFVSFLRVWANTVPSIQGLVPEAQHDLARVICGLPPLSASASLSSSAQEQARVVNGIAADLRAVAIEISQRRSFQDRYASDLQAALDGGTRSGADSPRRTTSFVPPPMYDESVASPPSSAQALPPPSPVPSVPTILRPGGRSRPGNISVPGATTNGGLLSPTHSVSSRSHSRSPSVTSTASSVPKTPTILTQTIEFIRETLYSSLFDVLSSQPSLRLLLQRDQTRAYFACVAFAILHVSTSSVDPETGSVKGVLGREVRLDECPAELKGLMQELVAIGRDAKQMMQEDDEYAIKLIQEGRDAELEEESGGSRMDRVRAMLEEGVGYELRTSGISPPPSSSMGTNTASIRPPSRSRRSIEGRTVAFANRINALSLGMTKLRAFRERQQDIFAILGGV